MMRYAMPNGVDNSCVNNSGVDNSSWEMSSRNVQVNAAASMPVSQWAGGSTRQLAIFPENASVAAQDFQWRFSSATVLQDGAFTQFPQHQRLLALRQGAGFMLQVDAHQQQVRSQLQVLRFAGSANSQATLIAGAVVDINLMVDASLHANLWSQPLTTEFQPWPRPLVALSTLLIYADEAPLDICLQPDEPVLHLAQGDLLQLAMPQPSLLLRATSPCTAVLAWVAPI